MSHAAIETAIDAAWEARETISPATKGEVRDAVEATLEALDKGVLRVAEKRGANWHVNQWAKKAVLLSFRLADNGVVSTTDASGPHVASGYPRYFDKVPSKLFRRALSAAMI